VCSNPTTVRMKIGFDPRKDSINRAKHGVSLGEAIRLDWSTAVARPDLRRDYGELRMIALGYIGPRLYYVVFVDRREGRRIISLRRANQREEEIYART